MGWDFRINGRHVVSVRYCRRPRAKSAHRPPAPFWFGACTGLSAAVVAVWALGQAVQAGQASAHWRAIEPLHNPHFVVVKSARELYVFDGPILRRTYPVRIGREPPDDQPAGNRKLVENRTATPVGRFQVCFKKDDSPFRRFIGLGYPDPDRISDAFAKGLLSLGELANMTSDLARGRCPSWRSVLGGGIGLHGRAEQSRFTRGCIALFDRHIDEVFDIIRTGDVVEILP